MSAVAVGIIGCGAWGRNHVRVVASEADCTLAGIADPDAQARERGAALAAGVRTFADAEQLLAAPDIDAVIIASPAPTHALLALAALTAGKHVLVEKPLAMSVADARAVAERARTMRRVGMVGHLMVYHPGVVKLRALLSSNELGALRYLHSSRVNLGRLRRDENALWSFGPHDLSMFDYLLERMPVSVAARGQCVLQPNVEDVVFLSLRYASGEMGHVHLSWLSPRKERRLTLVCAHKMAELDDVAADKLRVYDKGYDRPPQFVEYAEYLTLRDGDVHIPQLVMQEPLRLQLRDFLSAITRGTSPVASLESGLRVVRILEAAQLSLVRDGVPIDIPPAPSYASAMNVRDRERD
jgi:predicted dehydrogenase